MRPCTTLYWPAICGKEFDLRQTKHKWPTWLLAPCALAVLSGCSWAKSGYSALRSDQEAWVGHRSDELIASWGDPDETDILGDAYRAYTWIGDDGVCRRTFMDRDGVITGYSESDC